MKAVTVNASSSYDILIEKEILWNAGKYIKRLLGDKKLCIVTDDTVDALYSKPLEDSLKSQKLSFIKFVIPHGEASKNASNLISLLEFMATNRMTRSDALIALGGGVVGDLTGFAAGVYLRGVKFIQIPTTLLAMVDSSVGGKTAIDLEAGKNLAGVFHQPSLVLCDPETLDTLSDEIFADGCAEVIKYGIINDKDFFNLLKSGIKNNITEVIERCVKHKAEIVELDEFDLGARQLLNHGHTIGHAIESDNNLGDLLHGECVALGMLPMSAPEVRGRLVKVLEKYNLPTEIKADADKLVEFITHDKKASGDEVTVVYCDKIGTFDMKKVKVSEMKKYITEIF